MGKWGFAFAFAVAVVLVLVLVACGTNPDTKPDAQSMPDAVSPMSDAGCDACFDADPCATMSCDDGNPCTMDSCDSTRGCINLDPSACETPFCQATSCAGKDTDGDGFSDAWETNGGIDYGCKGTVEKVLTNVDPIFPNGQMNPTPSADPAVKDVFVKFDWMELADQLTNGSPTPCTVNPLSPPNNIFYPLHSSACDWDQMCISSVCRGHSDAPDGQALKDVIDAFARRGVRLHLVRGQAIAHANVTSFGAPVAGCLAERANDAFLGAQSADFYSLKSAGLKSALAPIFHYAVFAHRHTCDSPTDCAKLACQNPDSGKNPLFNETGIAEGPGNDFLVTFGGFRDRNIVPGLLVQGGTFMHELGHNLGLNHGGPLRLGGMPNDLTQIKLNFKPNYLSVMNYNHQTIGISTATNVGGITPAMNRLDYSSFCNPAMPLCTMGSHTPNTLDETNGAEANGIGIGTMGTPNNDIGYTWCNGSLTPIPGTGPVDFNCFNGNMETWCANNCDITPGIELNKDPSGGGTIGGDKLVPYEDWPNLVFPFQCEVSTYGDGAAFGALGFGEMRVEHVLATTQRRK